MTTQEIKTEIERQERERFYLAMKDFWDNKDYERDRKLRERIEELNKQLNA